jgi:hypothetical protein
MDVTSFFKMIFWSEDAAQQQQHNNKTTKVYLRRSPCKLTFNQWSRTLEYSYIVMNSFLNFPVLKLIINVGFEVLTAVVKKSTVAWSI